MSGPPDTVRANIDAVARLEQRARTARNPAERIADAIAGAVGTVWFVAAHLVLFALWTFVNLGAAPGVAPFDPYPFTFLCMLVSLEAVLLSAFVLIKQNRMSARADERAHLDLQVGLLTEREQTEALRLLTAIARRLGVPADDPALAEMRAATAVDDIAEAVKHIAADGETAT